MSKFVGFGKSLTEEVRDEDDGGVVLGDEGQDDGGGAQEAQGEGEQPAAPEAVKSEPEQDAD